MTPERLAEIEMGLTKRFDLLHPTWLYAACIDLAAALDACERLRAAAEADADMLAGLLFDFVHDEAVRRALAAHAAAVAMRVQQDCTLSAQDVTRPAVLRPEVTP